VPIHKNRYYLMTNGTWCFIYDSERTKRRDWMGREIFDVVYKAYLLKPVGKIRFMSFNWIGDNMKPGRGKPSILTGRYMYEVP